MGPFSLAAVALSLLGPPAPGACGDSYTVARHDTLYSIARRCGFGVGEIARANRLDPTRIAAGQRLVLPQGGGDGAGPRRREGRVMVYRFRHGDTLYSLARWARVDLRALLAANPCIDPRDIDAGTAIRLPPGAVAPEPARLSERGTPHLGMPLLIRTAPPPPLRPAPPPRPPRAVPPPPPRDDAADEDEGKPAGDANIPEEEEPEGL
ncbi:MAG TPA: LysM peptidoglycan-binding domain-containing protein [Allosphingosinicella sp.]|jgi:LysM repeat protein|nr:LysM peptidoglycan-binding domain-containing protein [Allosphingosinicella sp.]